MKTKVVKIIKNAMLIVLGVLFAFGLIWGGAKVSAPKFCESLQNENTMVAVADSAHVSPDSPTEKKVKQEQKINVQNIFIICIVVFVAINTTVVVFINVYKGRRHKALFEKREQQRLKEEAEMQAESEIVTPQAGTVPQNNIAPQPSVAPVQNVAPQPSVTPVQNATPQPNVMPVQNATPQQSTTPQSSVTTAPGVTPNAHTQDLPVGK